ncbi:MAG: hypothetical protein ACRCS9_00465 [Hyphomicrobium sp.]
MTDKKNDPKLDTAGGRRPITTLDLKATEIKVTPISESKTTAARAASATASAAPVATAPSAPAPDLPLANTVPLPAPARSYWVPSNTQTTATSGTAAAPKYQAATGFGGNAASAAKVAASATPTGSTQGSAAKPAATTSESKSAPVQSKAEPQMIVKKRGGFFSHLAASLIGGAIALTGGQWLIPHLKDAGINLPIADATAPLQDRLAKLERNADTGAIVTKVSNAEARLAAVEKSIGRIADIENAQARLVAETKAALAASASDAGGPDQGERLVQLENKFKALETAGANDPSSGRLEQLAALTGKVADLETSLATQLGALRKSVAQDVEARVVASAEASEAARSGTLRIDRDVANVKTETVRIAERLQALKTDNDRLAETLKLTQDENTALKAALEALRANVAKPQDVATAITPVTSKMAALEENVQRVLKAENDRRANAERIVLSLELQNLKRAVDRGQRYDVEFAEVEKAAAGKVDLAALGKYKEQGVPPLADLTREFRANANAIVDAAREPADGTVLDRLLAGAKSVVKVRKVDHAPDDKSPEAVVGRMEVALKEGRLADALKESGELAPKSKEQATAVLDKIAARATVEQALATVEAQLKTSLSATPDTTGKSTE